MIDFDTCDIFEVERNIVVSANGNDAALADDHLVETPAIFKFDGNDVIAGPGFVLSLKGSDSFGVHRN